MISNKDSVFIYEQLRNVPFLPGKKIVLRYGV